MADMVIKTMEKEDIPSLAELEKICFTTPWSEKSLRDELNNPLAKYLVVKIKDEIVAYVGYWQIIDEAHMTNLAVKPEYRRQGIARHLLLYLIDVLKLQKIDSLTLEVRTSNEAAKSLYYSLGFENAGIRKKYYEDNNEDALILWLRDITQE